MLSHLRQRGLVAALTHQSLEKILLHEKITLYAGIDPSAPSLHVGHLLPLMVLLHFYLHGHKSIALIGNSTVQLGDPSGRATQRNEMDQLTQTSNANKISNQVSQFFENGRRYAFSHGFEKARIGEIQTKSNQEWLGDLKMLDFMSHVGKNTRLSHMLARESVKARLASEQGMSFAEFSYQLLQAYDFYFLNKTESCTLQIGGSDQWGNITAGIDLISRTHKNDLRIEPRAFGLTVPLLTAANGEKFGKSAGNAIWLDPGMSTPLELYQYFTRSLDTSLEDHFKMFTLLPLENVSEIMKIFQSNTASKAAPYILAKEITTLIHGKDAATKAELATRILFDDDHVANSKEILNTFKNDPLLIRVSRHEVIGELISKVLRDLAILHSRAEAESLIKGGGLYINTHKRQVRDQFARVENDWLINDRVLILRCGKWRYNVLEII